MLGGNLGRGGGCKGAKLERRSPAQARRQGDVSDAGGLTLPWPCRLQKYHGGKTKVMASGLRTKAEALALAGCDFLVVVSAVHSCAVK